MRAPALTRKLTLQSSASVPDGAGGYTKSWTTLGTLWAEVTPGNGRDVAGIEVSLSTVNYVITVRAVRSGSAQRPVAGQLLVEGTRRFAILAVTDVGSEGRYVRCYAREEAQL